MNLQITLTGEQHIPQLVEQQQLCFPYVDPDDLMTAEQFAAQLRVFAAGQHVALLDGQVVGQSSTFRIAGARALAQHSYREITGHNRFTQHDPAGDWLYGADMSVHPDYRGRGVATALYTARKALVSQLGLRGIIAGGSLPGYQPHSPLSVETYIAAVVAGQRSDPTLTPQLKNGFTVRGVLRNYLPTGDSSTTAHATLLVWEVC